MKHYYKISYFLIFEIKNYASKQKAILTRFEKKRQFQPLLLLASVVPLQQL
jgi:hypothetical protein